MATSSKVQFRLDELREKALAAIDFEIRETTAELAAFDDDDSILAELIASWRAEQEARVSALFSQLGEDNALSNEQLAAFKVDPLPKRDPYERVRASRRLRELRVKRSKIEAKSSSLVADEGGTVSLTKTQLEEFFGL